MSEKPTRSRRREAMERLYTARDLAGTPGGDPFRRPDDPEAAYTPNEDTQTGGAVYTPNEPGEQPTRADAPFVEETQDFSAYTPNEPPASPYARPGQFQETEGDGPAFAPAPKMDLYAYAPALRQESPEAAADPAAGNVYRPREVTWADTQRREAVEHTGYQVREEAVEPAARKRRAKRFWKRGLILVGAAAVLSALWLLREPILSLMGKTQPEQPVSSTAPAPTEAVKAYTTGKAAEITGTARNAISQLGGTVTLEPAIVTDANVVVRSPRSDGLYDYYLFTAQGRLLCYFEGLGPRDMIPLTGGAFYVKQSPWLVASDGSALIRTADLEKQLNAQLRLHPMQRGWAIVENLADGTRNLLNADGQTISTLWFDRLFPFTGAYTLGYVDTGSEADQRYLLYVLGQDGQAVRWMGAAHMEDVVGCASGMAYFSDGSLYCLPDTQQPAATASQVDAYPDCGAVVALDSESGKYGLFVDGVQHYACEYDRIQPMESDLVWDQVSLGSFTIHAVQAGQYPMPLAYSFALEKDGQIQYVSLSAEGDSPILLEGEFEGVNAE